MLRSSKISLNASLVETRGKDSISSMPLAVYIILNDKVSSTYFYGIFLNPVHS